MRGVSLWQRRNFSSAQMMSYEQNTDFIKTRFFDFFKIWFYDEKSIPRHEKRVPGPARTLPDPENWPTNSKKQKTAWKTWTFIKNVVRLSWRHYDFCFLKILCLANPIWEVNDAAILKSNAINSSVTQKLHSNAQQLTKYLGKPG